MVMEFTHRDITRRVYPRGLNSASILTRPMSKRDPQWRWMRPVISVITWSSYGQDGSQSGVLAQRYNAAGVAEGGEFQVNSYTTGR